MNLAPGKGAEKIRARLRRKQMNSPLSGVPTGTIRTARQEDEP